MNNFQYFIDCIMDGITIMGSDGTILMLNQVSVDNCPYTKEELIDKNVLELIAKGMFDSAETVCFEVVRTGMPFSLMQKNATQKCDLLVTGIPYFEEGKLTKVILTERDITELNDLKDAIAREARKQKHFENEIAYYRAKNLLQGDMISQSSCMVELLNTVVKVAPLDITVSIQGECGTGKSLLARLIYEHSSRSKGPFIEISCAAIPENLLESELFGYEKGAFTGALAQGKVGLFELANGGTLFLDEIGILPLHLQTKILRAIQEKEIMRVGGTKYIPVDARIITATNINLEEAVRQGTFRQDLFYRINVVPLVLPPLRNRKECIRPLCEHFLSRLNKKYNRNVSFQASAWKLLYRYKWPGNVRELENMMERILIISDSDIISADQIAPLFPESELDMLAYNNSYPVDLKEEIDAFEKKLLKSKLPFFKSIEELSQALNVDRSTISRKLKKFDLKI
ncbi:MAG: sigma 54-interacting transcriptional regulator [Clostridiaceae bacterium]|nr:sigma 54-interacting transcriptional regulator [Clostridiaceae bacterium]